ncbi:MAG: histidine kinase, partial [Firmicutes bacterium]|nr:histidine kinase [Bacillota bacterium]
PAASSKHRDKIKIEHLLQQNDGTPGTVFVFPHGLGNNISTLLRQLHDFLGPGFDYVGGGTGDNLGVCQSYQITDKGVATEGFALAILHGINGKLGLAHSWQPMGEPMLVTKAKGKRVYELDNLPAFSRYAISLGGIGQKDFPHVAMRYPLGIPCAGGDFLIRDPLRVEADGSMVFVTEIPSNTVATIMVPRLEDNLSNEARKMLLSTVASVNKPQIVLIFDCVSRYLLLREIFEQELTQALANIDPAVPVLGFLSFGEISSLSGTPLYYNKCITVAVGG